MKENTNIFQKVKNFYDELDACYDTNSKNKKDIIIGSLIMFSMFVFSVIMIIISKDAVKYFYYYLFIIISVTLMLILSVYLYDNPPKKIKSYLITRKLFKIAIVLSVSLFFISFSPVLLFFGILNIIASILNIEIFARNIHIILIDISLYIIAYLICIFSYQADILQYMSLILIMCLIVYKLRDFIYKKTKFISYQEKYDYLYNSKRALIYIVNVFTIFSSIAGLYFSKTAIYYILPIIIFSGIEQIFLAAKQKVNEKQKFVSELYEELVILHSIAYQQIKDFSCIKIKIKLSVAPYMIENYKNYFQYGNSKYKFIKLKIKSNKKEEFLINVLDDCKTMLLKEYEVYRNEEKIIFEQDLFNNIENLARYLTDLR